MSVFACGNNSSKQIKPGSPNILCCPTLLPMRGVIQVQVTFSHIIWKTQLGWRWTGYKCNDVCGEIAISPASKVSISETRTVAINDIGSVAVWEKKGWRTLLFQKGIKEEADTFSSCHPHSKNQKYTENRRDANKHEDCDTLSCDLFIDTDDSKLPLVPVEEKHMKEACSTKSWKRKQLIKSHNSNTEKKSKLVSVSEDEDKLYDADSSITGPKQTEPVTNFPHTVFCQVAVEDNALLALDKDGVIYCATVPVPLRLKITEVAVGKEHSMALTANGDVLTWGSGMRGQLGDGELCQKERPLPVESLQGIIVSSISCGGWHCVALSNSGDVYIWGWNESGQLGFPAKSETNHLVFNSFEHVCQCPKNVTVQNKGTCSNTKVHNNNVDTKVQNNSDNISSYEKEEKVFELTRREQNSNLSDERLNRDFIKDVINVQASPRLLDFWSENVKIADVQCGDRHTLFHLDDGSAWSVGMNKYGQLGLGHTETVEKPTEVFRMGVTKIYAGGWNSVFVTT